LKRGRICLELYGNIVDYGRPFAGGFGRLIIKRREMIIKVVSCPCCGGSGKVRNWLTGKRQLCKKCLGGGKITQVVTPKN